MIEEDLAGHIVNLQELAQDTLTAVLNSVSQCPVYALSYSSCYLFVVVVVMVMVRVRRLRGTKRPVVYWEQAGAQVVRLSVQRRCLQVPRDAPRGYCGLPVPAVHLPRGGGARVDWCHGAAQALCAPRSRAAG